jgi:hypothetical protein
MVNHKKKFIFVHIPKCGGSSIETFLGFNLWSKLIIEEDREDIFIGRDSKTGKCLQHSTISEIYYKFYIRKKINISNYFSFSFVRNPYDKCISSYFYTNQYQKKSFKEFLLKYEHHDSYHNMNQCDFVTDKNGKIAVDFIGRFENLQEDFDHVCKKIGVKTGQIPHQNKSLHNNYREYYNEETKAIVEKKFKKDLDLFEYKF